MFRGIAITAAVVLFLSLAVPDAHRPLLRAARSSAFTAAPGGAGPAAARCARSAPSRICSSSWRAPTRAALQLLVLLSIACYWLMAFEVLLVFWAIGAADLALDRHHRRNLHAIGQRRRRRDPRQPRRARSVERRGGQGARPGRRRHARAVPPVPQPAVRDAGPGALPARRASRPEDASRSRDHDRGVLATIQDWASELGGVGLFIIALLDSSFLSFPQVNDS